MNKLNGKKGLFSIKVDLEKAYNKMKWKYVEKMLMELILHLKPRHIIMSSISFVSMRTIWNGQKGDYFKLKKWLKQGDLISLCIIWLWIL